jgi:tetratricopeptide (TPR) repeat protein
MTSQDYPSGDALRQGLGELRGLLGKAFQRSALWMHLVAIFAAFTSDVLHPLLHYCSLWLFVAALAVVVGLLFVARGAILRTETRTAAALFFLITAVLSLAVLGLQKIEGDPNDGAFGHVSNTVRDLQKKLDIVSSKADTLNHKLDTANRNLDELARKVDEISRETSVPLSALQQILARLGESNASGDPDKIEQLLRAKAEEYVALRTQLTQLSADDPNVRALQKEAETLFAKSDFAGARKKLDQAAEMDRKASVELASRAKSRAQDAIRSLERSADVAIVSLQYRAAADDLAEAAGLAGDPHEAWRLTVKRADALFHLGEDFGDNAALSDSIAAYRTALIGISETQYPNDSAATQAGLGLALLTLGDRQTGTARLEESVAACRAALKLYSSGHAQLDWARTQTQLGNALLTLYNHESERGTQPLEEALAAYRVALSVYAHHPAGPDWANAQDDLGNALYDFGEAKNSIALDRQALAAHLAALTAYDPHRQPTGWAATQNNVAITFVRVGERANDVDSLRRGIDAFNQALKVYTHARYPLDWAMTENNLSTALDDVGNLESGTVRLTEAVAAARSALQEWTRRRDPPDWAMAQYNLGNALRDLGVRERNPATLDAAIAAYNEALEEYTPAADPENHNLAVENRSAAQADLLKLKANKP